MKLDKAIEIVNNNTQGLYNPENPDFWYAMKLGIEALKAVKANRDRAFGAILHQLPGETED